MKQTLAQRHFPNFNTQSNTTLTSNHCKCASFNDRHILYVYSIKKFGWFYVRTNGYVWSAYIWHKKKLKCINDKDTSCIDRSSEWSICK